MALPSATRYRSFPPVIDGDTRLLILGSLPGTASLAAGRYYAHPQNQFWRLVGGAIGRDIAGLDYEARLMALRAAGVGLWDMVAEAAREGSLDSAIRDHRANDLAGLVATLPALIALAFNGRTAAALALRHFPRAPARYEILALPSSSSAYTLALADKQRAWAAIGDHLVKADDPGRRSQAGEPR
jgi:TDG/mug DNA glycosylase family protein